MRHYFSIYCTFCTSYLINVHLLSKSLFFLLNSILPLFYHFYLILFLNILYIRSVLITGLDIHFIHTKPSNAEGKRVLPLLLVHGWPGSVMEFYKIIPLLTSPRPEHDFVFEVIVPSLPGFGFSSAAVISDLSALQMSVVLKNLMLRLGHDKYYVQGGDWGAIVIQTMSCLYPQQ